VSLVAFASTYLSAAVVFERTRPQVPRRSTPGLRTAALGTTLYVLGVVYLGAYVRHAGVSLGCVDWPLCNGQVVPPLNGPTGIVFAHRLAALGAVALLAWLMHQARSANLARGPAAHAFGFGVLQALSGALVVWSHLGLFSTLLHAAVMGVLFASLAAVVRLALRSPQPGDVVARWFSQGGPSPVVADTPRTA
jgi:cytochrome c oxidase assembly protein subunit 15